MRVLADLQAENAKLRDDVRQLAERVAVCSELLGKRAERRGLRLNRRDDGTVELLDLHGQTILSPDTLQWLIATYPAVVGVPSADGSAKIPCASGAPSDVCNNSGRCARHVREGD